MRTLARRSRGGSEGVPGGAPVGALPVGVLPDSLGMRRPLRVREEGPASRVRRTLWCCTGVGAVLGVGVNVAEPEGKAARDEAMVGDEFCDWLAEFIVGFVVLFRFRRSSTSSESFVWSSTRCATRALSDCCFISMRLVAGRGWRSPSTAVTAMRVAGGMADNGAPSGSRWDIAAPRLGRELGVCKCILSRVITAESCTDGGLRVCRAWELQS